MSCSTETVNCTPCYCRDCIAHKLGCGKLKEKCASDVTCSPVSKFMNVQLLTWCIPFLRTFRKKVDLQPGVDVFPSFRWLEHPTEWYSVLLQILLDSSETSKQITCVWTTSDDLNIQLNDIPYSCRYC